MNLTVRIKPVTVRELRAKIRAYVELFGEKPAIFVHGSWLDNGDPINVKPDRACRASIGSAAHERGIRVDLGNGDSAHVDWSYAASDYVAIELREAV